MSEEEMMIEALAISKRRLLMNHVLGILSACMILLVIVTGGMASVLGIIAFLLNLYVIVTNAQAASINIQVAKAIKDDLEKVQ